MASERIGDMTRDELEALIVEVITKHFGLRPFTQHDDRSASEIFKSMRKNIIKPKPGQPSAVDMIREDRDCHGRSAIDADTQDETHGT